MRRKGESHEKHQRDEQPRALCLLTGDGDAVQQAMLKQILLDYKAKYPEKVGHFGEMDLAAIVKEMTAE